MPSAFISKLDDPEPILLAEIDNVLFDESFTFIVKFVVSDESISNEVVNQIIKSDISEEIDRLEFHKSSLLEELGSKKAKGKKIDFILLEMLREVNTILAKVTFTKEKKYALDIKINIEEMREQVSNVE